MTDERRKDYVEVAVLTERVSNLTDVVAELTGEVRRNTEAQAESKVKETEIASTLEKHSERMETMEENQSNIDKVHQRIVWTAAGASSVIVAIITGMWGIVKAGVSKAAAAAMSMVS